MEQGESVFQVIIAHPIPEEGRQIAELLTQSGLFSVCYMTHNGEDCLSKAIAMEPDLVIVHSVLEGIDGLAVLQKLAELSMEKTKRLYLTSYNSYLTRHAAVDGVDHCILMPCSDGLLLRRAMEVVLPPRISATDAEIDAHTTRILQDIGAPNNMKGYYYTVDAVRTLVRDPELVLRRAVTTELYVGVAKRHGVKRDDQVERCVRTLTDHIFMHSGVQVLRRYFSLADIQRSHIKNSVFLTTIARCVTDALRLQNKPEDRGAQED